MVDYPLITLINNYVNLGIKRKSDIIMEQAEFKGKKKRRDSWWRKPLQIAIILMATSFGFVLRENFLKRSN
mgnify:CR=1 FL=1